MLVLRTICSSMMHNAQLVQEEIHIVLCRFALLCEWLFGWHGFLCCNRFLGLHWSLCGRWLSWWNCVAYWARLLRWNCFVLWDQDRCCRTRCFWCGYSICYSCLLRRDCLCCGNYFWSYDLCNPYGTFLKHSLVTRYRDEVNHSTLQPDWPMGFISEQRKQIRTCAGELKPIEVRKSRAYRALTLPLLPLRFCGGLLSYGIVHKFSHQQLISNLYFNIRKSTIHREAYRP